MGRRVFFAFHYQREIWRANIVRNSWLTKEDWEDAGFFDASLWEDAETHGPAAVKRLIDGGLRYTSVTAVLIGAETADRHWVRYEIEESCKRGNGLIGIRIHRLEDRFGQADLPGRNPFDEMYYVKTGVALSSVWATYDWVRDDGYLNLKEWVALSHHFARATG